MTDWGLIVVEILAVLACAWLWGLAHGIDQKRAAKKLQDIKDKNLPEYKQYAWSEYLTLSYKDWPNALQLSQLYISKNLNSGEPEFMGMSIPTDNSRHLGFPKRIHVPADGRLQQDYYLAIRRKTLMDQSLISSNRSMLPQRIHLAFQAGYENLPQNKS